MSAWSRIALSLRLGVTQSQDRLAVVEIVPGKELIQPDKILPQRPDFDVVKLLEKRRDGIGGDRRPKIRQQLRQLRRDLRQFLQRPVRRRNAHVKFQVEHVTLRIEPLDRGRAAWRRIDLGVDRDPAPQFCGIELPADDGSARRWRRHNFRRRASASIASAEQAAACSGGDVRAKSSAPRSRRRAREREAGRTLAASSGGTCAREAATCASRRRSRRRPRGCSESTSFRPASFCRCE